jgi:hypothetical protein
MMLAGHYSASFLLKKVDPSIKLWHLFLAVQLLDVLWAIFILLGIEKADMSETLPALPIHLTYMPYTHSLPGALFWSLAACCAYRFFLARGQGGYKASIIIGAAVFSHWLLDLLVHDKDMPLIGNHLKVGFGLYGSILWSQLIEFALLGMGLILYWRMGRSKLAPALLLVFIAMALVNALSIWGPEIPSASFVAVFNLCYYLTCAVVIARLERKIDLE